MNATIADINGKSFPHGIMLSFCYPWAGDVLRDRITSDSMPLRMARLSVSRAVRQSPYSLWALLHGHPRLRKWPSRLFLSRGRGTVGAWLLTGHCTRRISRRAGHVGPDGVGLQIRLFLTICPSARCFPNFFTVAVCRFRLRFGGAALALPSNWGILVLQRVHPTRTGTAARKRANYQRC